MGHWEHAVPEPTITQGPDMRQKGSLLKPIELCLIDREHGVRDALARLLAALGPLNLAPEERNTVELVLAEVLNNILEHAYPGLGPVGTIRLCAMLKHDGLHVRVLDDGAPMPGGLAPLGMSQDLNIGIPDLPEGGFGWFLIRDLARDVTYRRVEGHNQLDLRIAIAFPRSH